MLCRYDYRKIEIRTLAIGIKGELSSLCGAIKRFKRHGAQWNGLLTLKEQCARRIALIKNEQLKCFITAYLPPTLFKYVTKDIFNLQRPEFTSNYAKPLAMCKECVTDIDRKPGIKCRCPNLEAAIYKLNKHFVKRMNHGNDKTETDELKQFELIYKTPQYENWQWVYEEEPISFVLYLSPCELYERTETYDSDDTDDDSYQSHEFMNVQVSVEEKLLFVDAMRFLGAFHSEEQQPCADKHNILMRYYVCNILPASYRSSVILFLPNVSGYENVSVISMPYISCYPSP
jgi:hypothetical protein